MSDFARGLVFFSKQVLLLAEQPSVRLLKHIVRCYLRLSDNPRAREALRECLPELLRSPQFTACLKDDATTRRWGPAYLFLCHGAMHCSCACRLYTIYRSSLHKIDACIHLMPESCIDNSCYITTRVTLKNHPRQACYIKKRCDTSRARVASVACTYSLMECPCNGRCS